MIQARFRLAFVVAALVLAGAAQAQAKSTIVAQSAAAPAATPSGPSTTDLENMGKMAAQGWLALLDRQDWGTAWDASAQMFRASVPLGMWMDKIPPVRQPLGPLVERQVDQAIYKTSLPGRPDGQYVTVRFISKFQKGTIQEIVATVLEQDGHWRVTGYQPGAL